MEPSNGQMEAGFDARPYWAKKGQNQHQGEILKMVSGKIPRG